MKKLLIFILTGLVALIVGNCTDRYSTDLQYSEKRTRREVSSRSLEEAAKIALEHAEIFYPNASRNKARCIDYSNIQYIATPTSRGVQGDTLIYVINFTDNQGFALVSVPKSADAVLALVENGTYDEQTAEINTGFQFYLDAAREYCSQKIGDQSNFNYKDPREDFKKDTVPVKLYDVLLDTIVDSYSSCFLMNIAWGQTGLYGKYCPNGISGCVPTAMGQIITVCNTAVNRPHMEYTFPEADIESEEINWAQLKWHIHKSAYYVSEEHGTYFVPYDCREVNPELTHKTIGRLLRQIGYDAGSEYKSDGTATYKDKYRSVLQKYLPDRDIPHFKSYDCARAQRDLDHGMLLMRADNKIKGQSGHAWVADGYRWVVHNQQYRVFDLQTNEWGPWIYTNSQQHYNHFVWGWDGYLDGYYAGVVFECLGETLVKPEYIAVKKYVD